MSRFAKAIHLSPYPATLYVAKTRAMYEAAHREIFDEEDKLNDNQTGRFSAGRKPGCRLLFLIWANSPVSLVHELGHVVLVLFEDIGADPKAGNGEPFCYLLGHLFARVTGGNPVLV